MIEKEKLMAYIADRLSYRQIARKESVSIATIQYWLKLYDLKTIRAIETKIKIRALEKQFRQKYVCTNCGRDFVFPINRVKCPCCGGNLNNVTVKVMTECQKTV